MINKKQIGMFIVACFLLTLAACGGTDSKQGQNEEGVPDVAVGETETPIVSMEMENGGIVKLELYPEIAPKTVNNFVALVEDGFYDGLTFHRIIPGFMIQGGDPNGDGTGGPGYEIKGEFSNNGIDNPLSHERGVISMARTQEPDSAGSQFFIMHEDALDLDGDYAAFGKVIEGMDVVDEIAEQTETETGGAQEGRPVAGHEQVIKKMTVER
ncbi:peptidylprolyl isomerase [Bacillus sp. FSL W8-1122]